MTIGELAKQARVTLRTVRFYEEKSLITPEPSGDEGQKRFSVEALITLRKIKLLKEAGLSLQEIGTILDEYTQSPTLAKERQQKMDKLLFNIKGKISGKINELETFIKQVNQALKYSDSCKSCSADNCDGCSILNTWQNFGFKMDKNK